MDHVRNLDLVKRNLITALNLIFPGVFIIETVFQRGLFSGGIESIYDFLLLIVWAIALSLPLQAFAATFVKPGRMAVKLENVDLGPVVHGAILFPFSLALAVILSFLTKLMVFVDPFGIPAAPIPSLEVYFLMSLATVLLVAFPLVPVYRLLLRKTILAGVVNNEDGSSENEGHA